MNEDKNFIAWIIFALLILLALIGIGFVIFVYVKYGNVPIKDLPAWVLPFFNK